MAAYVLMTRDQLWNAEELAIYNELAPSTFAGHPATFLVFHGKPQTLEGSEAEDVMLAVFPSVEEANAWYESDAYSAARMHRQLGGNFRCFIVEGSTPGAKPK